MLLIWGKSIIDDREACVSHYQNTINNLNSQNFFAYVFLYLSLPYKILVFKVVFVPAFWLQSWFVTKYIGQFFLPKEINEIMTQFWLNCYSSCQWKWSLSSCLEVVGKKYIKSFSLQNFFKFFFINVGGFFSPALSGFYLILCLPKTDYI